MPPAGPKSPVSSAAAGASPRRPPRRPLAPPLTALRGVSASRLDPRRLRRHRRRRRPGRHQRGAGLAQKGAKVLLLERGEYPGAKNMFGGMMAYCPAPEQLVPGFWERAPWERAVTKRVLSVVGEGFFHLSGLPGRLRFRPTRRWAPARPPTGP